MVVVRVPTINDKPGDFDRLFGIWQQVEADRNSSEDIIEFRFDFSSCGFLRQNAVAFLGAMARLIEYKRGTVAFDWDTL